MLNQKQIIALLRADVVPALGCTEPVCVALCSAYAASVLDEPITKIQTEVSSGIFKNGMSAGIPNFSQVGLPYAATLGALLKNPEKGLELLADINDNIVSHVLKLTEDNIAEVSIDHAKTGVYAKCTLTGVHSQSTCIIEGAHTNVVYLAKGETIIKQETRQAGTASSNTLVDELVKMKIAEIRELVDTIESEELTFLMDGVDMNLQLASYSEETPAGVGLASVLRKEKDSGLLSNDLVGNMITKVVSAAESRLDGCPLPTMSSSGAGTKGLVVILPVYETAKAIHADKNTTLRALALSHLVNRYINAYIGKLSPMCSCIMASSTAASVGIAYLLGGTDESIGHAIRNMSGTVTGMICDGGKVGCSLKVATGTMAAFISAITAVQGAALRVSDGICAETPEQCIKNIALIGTEGMKETDKTILKIMQNK